MQLTDVKTFLKVDFDDDDEYIQLLIDVAQEYIVNAVGNYDETKALVRLLSLTIISTLYQNREYTIETANEKVQYTLKSMVSQLQLDEVLDE